ncbi:MAG TPA: HAD hydrolase-like protein [Clostridiales bacterium]|nr:HAD hydrolase-like protein [Clostridiales bacterium]
MALIFFDYDGVMVDSLEAEANYYIESCQEVGVEAVKNKADMARLSESNFYESLRSLGISDDDIKKINGIYARVKKDGRFSVTVFPEMFQLIQEVGTRFPVYVITSNISETVENSLKEHGVTAVREVLGADKETSKEKKILSVMDKYPGERTLFLGDTKGDMVESAAAGINIRLGVTWGWQRREVVLSGDPDYYFDAISDLVAWFHGFLDAQK